MKLLYQPRIVQFKNKKVRQEDFSVVP